MASGVQAGSPAAFESACGGSTPPGAILAGRFMGDVIRRSGLHVRFRCELYTGRRRDVDRLRERLKQL